MRLVNVRLKILNDYKTSSLTLHDIAEEYLREEKMNKIVVIERTDDFHAQLSGRSDIWGCGKSPREAIGNLVATWPRLFKIEIQYDFGENRSS